MEYDGGKENRGGPRRMDTKKKVTGSPELLDLLEQTLELEYTLIIHYPRIASVIHDNETKQLAVSLGTASIGHADIVAHAITKLGGTPHWSFGAFPARMDLTKIFQGQLEKEKLALKLHQQIIGLTTDSSLREKFIGMSKEEESHVKTVEKILLRLK
jgi:bacterioferritin (cytochrome b1)